MSRQDPQLAALLTVETARWLADTPETRIAEAELLTRFGPHQPEHRSQFSFYDMFKENITVLHGGPGDHLFLYDHDLITLYDGRDPAAPQFPNRDAAWATNDEVVAGLNKVLVGQEKHRIRSIRLHLFEGTRRIAPAISANDAAHLVSHLSLWNEHKEPETSLATLFPQLLGLSAEPSQLPHALSDGAPNLRSLVVHGKQHWTRTLRLAAKLPRLEHLSLWAEDVETEDIIQLAHNPLIQRLRSLEFFGNNYTNKFPFDTVLAEQAFHSLQRLGLPGHLVGQEVRSRFAHRPEVEFISHDRRSRIVFDLETTGWAPYMR